MKDVNPMHMQALPQIKADLEIGVDKGAKGDKEPEGGGGRHKGLYWRAGTLPSQGAG